MEGRDLLVLSKDTKSIDIVKKKIKEEKVLSIIETMRTVRVETMIIFRVATVQCALVSNVAFLKTRTVVALMRWILY